MEREWVVYILECRDGTLYTGITNNLSHRLSMHEMGKGAKYTRGRSPVILRYRERCGDHSNALRREYEIKQLTKAKKLALICQNQPTEVT